LDKLIIFKIIDLDNKKLIMSDEENKPTSEDIKKERKNLEELGVTSTWNLLSDLAKKKKDDD